MIAVDRLGIKSRPASRYQMACIYGSNQQKDAFLPSECHKIIGKDQALTWSNLRSCQNPFTHFLIR